LHAFQFWLVPLQHGQGKLGVAEYAAQNVVEVVRHAAGQVPHRLHFRGLQQLLVYFRVHGFQLFALVDELHGAYHAHDFTAGVAFHYLAAFVYPVPGARGIALAMLGGVNVRFPEQVLVQAIHGCGVIFGVDQLRP
jgi:hypothetical protein